MITVELKGKLWESGMLGDYSQQVLVDTVLYLNGLNFTLRSGEEHCHLRHFHYSTPLKNPTKLFSGSLACEHSIHTSLSSRLHYGSLIKLCIIHSSGGSSS